MGVGIDLDGNVMIPEILDGVEGTGKIWSEFNIFFIHSQCNTFFLLP